MKPRNREVNVFNMSMLDVISGALGAVLIIMIVLSPFYGKDRTEAEYQALLEEIDLLEDEAEIGRIRNPFMVVLWWKEPKQDIDLFVAREGQEYDPTKSSRSMTRGDNLIGHSRGPGFEMALLRDTPPGNYEIYINRFATNGNTAHAVVSPYYMYAGEFYRLPQLTMRDEKKAFHLGTLVMDGAKNLTFRGATDNIQRLFEEMNEEE